MNSSFQTPTIAALATARGQAAVAVLRLSGREAWQIGETLLKTRQGNAVSLKHGQCHHGWLEDPQAHTILDEVLLLAFKAPKSFTGEDVIEIHCHGGELLSQTILNACFELGASPAGPGEFTQRALMNGKLDLTQAESIMDLIAAQSIGLAHLAAHNLRTKGLSGQLKKLMASLQAVQAQIVAHVDFPDEVDEPNRDTLCEEVQQAVTLGQSILVASQHHQVYRDGFPVAIIGLPNAGKSSLFNAFLNQDRSIVTDIAGTTRDVVTETLMMSGIPVTLFDTAGLHQTDNVVEQLGMERAMAAAQGAKAILFVFDLTCTTNPPHLPGEELLSNILEVSPTLPVAYLGNKVDLLSKTAQQTSFAASPYFTISTQTGEGLSSVLQWLAGQIKAAVETSESGIDQMMAISLNQRQTHCLTQMVAQAVLASESLLNPHIPLDVATVPLSEALYQMTALLGEDTTETMLSEVFSRFCVGK